MTASDEKKLVDAGFTIIRKEAYDPNTINWRIKYKGNGSHEWKTLVKGFATKAAFERKMRELLRDEKTVEN